MLALGKYVLLQSLQLILTSLFTVLHPYYKLAYIKLLWGGAEEQAAEFDAGNFAAKNWQDEAKKIVENTVCPYPFRCYIMH